ncbi:MAG: PepSY domain-containing protein [Acidobacteriota bacterium]
MKALSSGLVLFLLLPSAAYPRRDQETPPNVSQKEISRARAIKIAREHVKFQPRSIKAEKAVENGQKVWRVTFRGQPAEESGLMGEVMIVSVDRFTGKIVSIAQS